MLPCRGTGVRVRHPPAFAERDAMPDHAQPDPAQTAAPLPDPARPDPMRSDPPQPASPAGPPLRLCPSAALVERGRAHGFDVLHRGQPVRAFALRFDGVVRAYLNRCVHVAAELDWISGEFFDRERRHLICAVHGALYAPADGRCVAGPGCGGRLTPLAVAESGGWVHWYPSADICPAAAPGPRSPA